MSKRKYWVLGLVPVLVVSLLFAGCKNGRAAKDAHEEKHWSYTGDSSPEHWVAAGFVADGLQAQSPINIISSDTAAPDAAVSKPGYSYTAASYLVENNGHTIELKPDAAADNTFTLEGTPFTLTQLHFHAPSEHQLDGEHFAMEVHLVHKDSAENLAVLGFFIKEGAENTVLKEVFERLPAAASEETHLENPLDLSALFDPAQAVYRYDGSLTTPPCSEGVKWTVSAQALEFSADQIDAFKKLYAFNSRPVQPLNSRLVYLVP